MAEREDHTPPHAPCGSSVDLTLEQVEYVVAGATVRALLAAMRARGPRRAGRTHPAFTDWRVVWDLTSARGAAGVIAARVDVRVCAVMHLPRWRAPAGASAALRAAWQSYVAALEHHERGHVLLALEAGRAVRAALRALGAHADDDALHAAAWVASDAALDDVRERERRYDAETRDGEAHGACLAAFAADD